jgi:hypothetical protein
VSINVLEQCGQSMMHDIIPNDYSIAAAAAAAAAAAVEKQQ